VEIFHGCYLSFFKQQQFPKEQTIPRTLNVDRMDLSSSPHASSFVSFFAMNLDFLSLLSATDGTSGQYVVETFGIIYSINMAYGLVGKGAAVTVSN
jgi:hypothetical protein